MIFTEQRLATDGLSTVSELLAGGKRLCFTLEPGPRTPAYPCKPPGRYSLVLRSEGEKYQEYLKLFGSFWFKGIPQILVPGRDFIEVHIGNSIADTHGCSLLGQHYVAPKISSSGHYEVEQSRLAFQAVYPAIRDACLAGPCEWETLADPAEVVA